MTTPKHGGQRTNSGPKKLLADETVLAEWRTKLTRAIHMAHGNLNVIKKNTFWTTKEIRARWGNRGVREFKYWFGKAKKHYDAEKADMLLKEFDNGRLEEAKYKKLLYTQAYTWMWVLDEARERDVWKLTRGLMTIDDLMKGVK